MLVARPELKPTVRALERANMPKRNWNSKIAVYPLEMRGELNSLRDNIVQIINAGWCVWIAGPFGTGKTVFANILQRQAMAHAAETYFLRTSELLGAWNNYTKKELGAKKLCEIDLLILDDLGGEEGCSNMLQFVGLLSRLVRTRYESMKATVITTNLDPVLLERLYGKAFKSLLQRAVKSRLVLQQSMLGVDR